jgi:hypothetical protein
MKAATTLEALDTEDCTASVAAEPVGRGAGVMVRVDTPLPIVSAVTSGVGADCEPGAVTSLCVTVVMPLTIIPPAEADAVYRRLC